MEKLIIGQRQWLVSKDFGRLVNIRLKEHHNFEEASIDDEDELVKLVINNIIRVELQADCGGVGVQVVGSCVDIVYFE